MAVDAPARTEPAARRSPLGRLGSWDSAVIALTVVFIGIASSRVENFGTAINLGYVILDLTPLLMIALPMTLIILTGEIDLSVASTLGLSSAAMGAMWNNNVPINAIIVICVLLGVVLGAVNGLFVTVFGLPSLAVTIGTLALYRGLALVVLGDTAVADFPIGYTTWATSSIGGGNIPVVTIPLVLLVLAFGIFMHATPTGRALFAMGANKEAARFAGIRVNRVKFALYVASGAVSALAGVFWALRYASARADNGQGLELAIVAAVLLGGVSIFGGRGTMWGVIAGVVLLTSLQNALRLADVNEDKLTVVTGLLLIVSVLAPNIAGSVGSQLGRRRRRMAGGQVTTASE